jgi:aspartyl-tRNA(Asn)/glutamyl-tRNA(Gln) amidotransferase subunit A
MTSPHSAVAMSAALVARDISSNDLLESAFAAIDAGEPEVCAFISQADRDELKAEAGRIDDARARGDSVHSFAGVPIAVKDNIAVAEQRLTCGSRILRDYVTPFNATVIDRLRDAGLLILGKTNMDEFGFGSSTENSAFFPTRNPRALDRVPGGTSGGSAAAVAAGMVPWALGTDTGGSVRQPASLCGIVGFRPSYGNVSRYGIVSYSSSMDQVGPLATTVEDAKSLFSIIAGHDPLDATTLPAETLDDAILSSTIRIGVPPEYLSSECDAAVREAVESVARVAEGLGWSVSPASLPMTEYALSAYYLIASVEAASNLARYDGVKFGHRADGASGWTEMLTRSRTEGFGGEAKRRIMLGTFASSAGYEDKYYARACRVRTRVIADFASAFENVDVILSPVSPTTAWPLGERVDNPMLMYLADAYSVPAALAGLPAVVIPAALDEQELPIGVQLCGPRHADSRILGAARLLEGELVQRLPSSSSAS